MTTSELTEAGVAAYVSEPQVIEWVGLKKLSPDIKALAKAMPDEEARGLVRTYYQLQNDRIRAAGRTRAKVGTDKAPVEEPQPHKVAAFFTDQSLALEKQVHAVLTVWSMEQPECVWAQSIAGIGPVISSGLKANIDVRKALYMGAVWAYCGLNPEMVWKKGEKRPYNADMKVLAWKASSSFVKMWRKQSGERRCFYGLIYALRKAYELEQSEAGNYANRAAKCLAAKDFSRDTGARRAYLEGKIPPGQILASSMRFAAKMFLGHYWQTAYELHYGKAAPVAYILTQDGHNKEITRDHVIEWERGEISDDELRTILPSTLARHLDGVLAAARKPKEVEEREAMIDE